MTPPLASSSRAPGDLGDRGAQLRRRPCCRAAAAARRPRAPRSISRASRTSTSSVPASSGAAARARSTACAIPPAAAMWFSLIRIASYSPTRWLRAAAAATAAFSSARRPGVVLRVSSTCAPVPSHARGRPRGHRRDAREVRRGSSARCARPLSSARARPSTASTGPRRRPRASIALVERERELGRRSPWVELGRKTSSRPRSSAVDHARRAFWAMHRQRAASASAPRAADRCSPPARHVRPSRRGPRSQRPGGRTELRSSSLIDR